MYKKILSITLMLCIFSSVIQTVNASNRNEKKVDNVVAIAKTAFIKDVNETGTNLNDDFIDGSKNTKQDTKLMIKVNSDNSLVINTNLNGDNVVLTGKPVGKSENEKAIFFEGKSSNSKYSIVNFSFEEDISGSNVYFKNYKKNLNKKSSTILKIYLKVNDSDTRDYILLETFNPKLNFDKKLIEALPQNSILGSWVTTQFKPIESYIGEDTSVVGIKATTNTKYWICSKTFNSMGEDQTHVIRWRTTVDYSDVPVGQEVTEYYRFTVYDKTSTYEFSTNFNSNSESCLHVNKLSLDQTSVPYTAWKSTSIDGDVKKKNIFGGNLSASIGVSYGILSISYSIPSSFTHKGYVDIDELYDSYENGVNGSYTRSINTKMDTDYWMTDEGNYFEVRSALRDYGNSNRSSSTLKSRWHVEIINYGSDSMETYPLYCDHNVSVSIN